MTNPRSENDELLLRLNVARIVLAEEEEEEEEEEEAHTIVSLLDVTEQKRAEAQLVERHATLNALLESAAAPVFSLDRDYRYTSFNSAHASVMKGLYGVEIEIGQSMLEYPAVLEDREEARKNLDRALLGEQFVQSAISGEPGRLRRYFEVAHNPIFDGVGEVIGVSVFASDVTERKRAEQELAQSHEQMHALTTYWQASFEAERAHIAREIHDEFGQSMTALKMDLTWLAHHLPEGDEKVDRLRGMNTLVDDSIALMRRIATELRPGLLDDLGLNAALEWQAVEFSKRKGIPCKLNLPKDDLALDPALNTTLFRIFQETLTNIARHAQATRVSASLKQKEQTLILTIRDNGRGITEAELANPRSLGLLSLRERATQWGGQTTLRGAAGKGTTVTVRIPLPTSPVNGGKR